MLKIRQKGGERIIKKYKGFDGKRILRESQLRGANYGRIVLTTYPPPKPGSKYVRTYNLQRNWQVVEVRGGWSLINRLGYVKWVQDKKFQARQHRGRWRPAQVILRESADVARKEAEARVAGFIKS